MADCVFCKIAAGDIPAAIIDEDDHAFAFLDIRPLTRGHMLVVPKEHVARLADLKETPRRSLWDLVHGLVPRIEESVSADGMTVAVNDGSAAGQEVPHVHVHLVPRKKGDGYGPIHALFGTPKEADKKELGILAEQI
ncbi:MAG: HIT family protein [Euryarchaeota archaeon]|nr:HIT family protein [Euryarchaeota archaeon]